MLNFNTTRTGNNNENTNVKGNDVEEELKNVGFIDADEPVPTRRQVEEQEVEALVDCEYSLLRSFLLPRTEC